MVHEMTNTMDGQSLLGSGLESRMFGSVVEWELADHISKTARLGIADDLLKQISPQEAVNDPQTAR
jgi:Rod binding domain-containing protein